MPWVVSTGNGVLFRQAAAYKRYLEKFDKPETEIEDLQKSQKKLQQEEEEGNHGRHGKKTEEIQ